MGSGLIGDPTPGGPVLDRSTRRHDIRNVPNIGRYEVGDEIGRGAMGVVYLARDPRVDRQVALKVFSLRKGLPAEPESECRARFLREAHAAGALSHPAIVTIHDAGEDPLTRVPFIVMEHVPGEPITDYCDRHSLTVRERLELLKLPLFGEAS